MTLITMGGVPILQQLHLEERLLRRTGDNWSIVNNGTAHPTIVMGVSRTTGESLSSSRYSLSSGIGCQWSGGSVEVVLPLLIRGRCSSPSYVIRLLLLGCSRFLATSRHGQASCMVKCLVASANFICVKMTMHLVTKSLVEMLSP